MVRGTLMTLVLSLLLSCGESVPGLAPTVSFDGLSAADIATVHMAVLEPQMKSGTFTGCAHLTEYYSSAFADASARNDIFTTDFEVVVQSADLVVAADAEISFKDMPVGENYFLFGAAYSALTVVGIGCVENLEIKSDETTSAQLTIYTYPGD